MLLGATAPNPMTAALLWLEGTLLGTIATTVAIIAVATAGYLMLTGRIDMRRAVQVILGCFILFGASSIAGGIEQTLSGAADPSAVPEVDAPPPDYPAASPIPKAKLPVTDPYAGAAVPTRQ